MTTNNLAQLEYKTVFNNIIVTDTNYCKSCGDPTTGFNKKSVSADRINRFKDLKKLYKQAKKSGHTKKAWRVMGTQNVRSEHKKANGQTVGIDEYFTIGNEKLFLPSDPSASMEVTANCRCIVSYFSDTDCREQKLQIETANLYRWRKHQHLTDTVKRYENAIKAFSEKEREAFYKEITEKTKNVVEAIVTGGQFAIPVVLLEATDLIGFLITYNEKMSARFKAHIQPHLISLRRSHEQAEAAENDFWHLVHSYSSQDCSSLPASAFNRPKSL